MPQEKLDRERWPRPLILHLLAFLNESWTWRPDSPEANIVLQSWKQISQPFAAAMPAASQQSQPKTPDFGKIADLPDREAQGTWGAPETWEAWHHGTLPTLPPTDSSPADPHVPNLFELLPRERLEYLDRALSGLKAYHHAPAFPKPALGKIMARVGESCLYEFEPTIPSPAARKPSGTKGGIYRPGSPPPTSPIGQDSESELPPIFLLPSLINRTDVLHLSEEWSLVRKLTQRGHRVRLLDWGSPGPIEQTFDIGDYLDRAAAWLRLAREQDRQGQVLVGYCMGGTLSVPLAQVLGQSGDVAGLALMAAPWDFHATPLDQREGLRKAHEAWYNAYPDKPLTVDFLQMLFFSLDPGSAFRKFERFIDLDPACPKFEYFTRLEDWLNDGVELVTEVANDTLYGWYSANRPRRGEWVWRGTRIDPSKVRLPARVILPLRDRIVPPQSARVLADLLPQAEVETWDCGHISMLSPKHIDDMASSLGNFAVTCVAT